MKINKRTRNFFLMLGICALCFAAYGISVLVQKEEEEAPGEKNELLWNISSDDITHISYVYNENDAVELSCSDGEWNYAQDSSFALNKTMAGDMADALAGAEIEQKIEEEDADLLSFGLEVPSMTISFEDAEGAGHSLIFGNYNTAAQAYYAQKEDDGSVYMISAEVMSPFQYELYDLLVLDEIPAVAADYVSGVEVSWDGNIYVYTYEIEEAETTEEETTEETQDTEEETEAAEEVVWYVSRNGGEKEKCDSEEFAEYVDNILSIVSLGAVNYNAGSEESLRNDYGITDHYVKVDYVNYETDEDLSYILRFGGNDGDGSVYMTVGDSTMVQLASEDTVEEIFQK